MQRSRRLLRLLASLFACILSASSMYGQSNPVQGKSASSLPALHIALGRSVAPLYGPWKFSVGDSPLDPITHSPLWSEPDFDDSQWENVDLKPKVEAVDPVGGMSGYVPGWTALGHPGYWGYAWYRIRVMVEESSGEGGKPRLVLAGPPDVDDAYQVYVNGVVAGAFGNFSGPVPVVYFTQPMMFAIPQWPGPQPAGGGARPQMQVLAFRVWMEPSTLRSAPNSGGLHIAPLLGESQAVAATNRLQWLESIRTFLSQILLGSLCFLLAAVVFSLILFDRSDRVYLWLGTAFLLDAGYAYLNVIANWTQYVSYIVPAVLKSVLWASETGVWIMVWWVWFTLRRPFWLPRAVAGLSLLFLAGELLGEDLFFRAVPHAVAAGALLLSIGSRLLLFLLLLVVGVEGIRKHRFEGWLTLPIIVLSGIQLYGTELQNLGISVNWFPFGVLFGSAQLTRLLVIVTISVLLVRRLLFSVRRQRVLALDVKQAQELQKIILPESITRHGDLAIETEYRPAREVGGDFFQIIPHATDGSLLIVAGDVTGKGLQAGMLVALLVGGIRTVEQFDGGPLVLLHALNQRLIGRGYAHATCLALRISADGTVLLANAGHLPPYLNGLPVAMEGALPLGMLPDAEFSVTRFRIEDDDHLVIASDGIVEATDAHGQLFGFDRLQAMLSRSSDAHPPTAADLASAAQAFGQEDDISVIAIRRTLRYECVPPSTPKPFGVGAL